MTQSRASKPKAAATAATAATVRTVRTAATRAGAKALAARSKTAIQPTYGHPNLGLAPVDMTAGYPAAAEALRRNSLAIAAFALEAAIETDPSLRTRYDETGLRRLLRDAEALIERLAMCMDSGETRYLSQYAEWVGPIYRRRGVTLGDLSALCAGIRVEVQSKADPDELAMAERALAAATAVFERNGRLGGDRHKRNALLKWMYRGV